MTHSIVYHFLGNICIHVIMEAMFLFFTGVFFNLLVPRRCIRELRQTLLLIGLWIVGLQFSPISSWGWDHCVNVTPLKDGLRIACSGYSKGTAWWPWTRPPCWTRLVLKGMRLNQCTPAGFNLSHGRLCGGGQVSNSTDSHSFRIYCHGLVRGQTTILFIFKSVLQ